MSITVGDTLPEATLRTMGPDGPQEITIAELLSGKTTVLVAVPGAFTPTCHMNHVPGFVRHAEAFKAKGVDTIAVIAVNDVFVMDAWAKASDAEKKLAFLSDSDGTFTKALGMDIDLSAAGLGTRSKRYAMIVKDGKVATLAVEPQPGQADITGAPAILDAL